MFKGLSTLRADEDAKKPPPPVSDKAKALQAYLASKYTDAGDGQGVKKRKKKKPKDASAVIRIVDEDVSGFATTRGVADAEEADGAVDVRAHVCIATFQCPQTHHKS